MARRKMIENRGESLGFVGNDKDWDRAAWRFLGRKKLASLLRCDDNCLIVRKGGMCWPLLLAGRHWAEASKGRHLSVTGEYVAKMVR